LQPRRFGGLQGRFSLFSRIVEELTYGCVSSAWVYAVLGEHQWIVASYPDLKFKIEGHTDSTGTDATNNELSLKRSITVRDYLIGQHIAASAIDAQGLGSAQPVADNETADGRARNRRVEIVISGGLLAAN